LSKGKIRYLELICGTLDKHVEKNKITSKVCQGEGTSTLKEKNLINKATNVCPKLNNNDRVSARWIGG
jgi:hypothetical protein